MKPVLLIALVLASSGAAAQVRGQVLGQTGGPYNGNRNDLARMPESGPLVVSGGGATTGPNFRNLSVSPLPGSREEMDEIMRRPSEAQLAIPEVRPVPGPSLPPIQNRR